MGMSLWKVIRFCCSSVAQSCPTLWDHTDCHTPDFPVLHHLLKLAQTHVHWVGDASQPARPLSSPSPPALNLSQHQRLFYSIGSLPSRLPKYWNFSLSIRSSKEYSGLLLFKINWFDLSASLSQESSPKSQLEGINSLALSLLYGPNSHIHTWLLEKPLLWWDGPSPVK